MSLVRRVLIDNGFAIFALVTSLLSLAFTTCFSMQSLDTARRSIELFRESNDIMRGLVPQVQVYPEVLWFDVDSLDQLMADSPQQSLMVSNTSRVSISELTVDMNAVDGLVYRVDDLLENFHFIPPARERLVLTEQLIPEGRAHVRIKPCMLSYIDNANIDYSNRDVKYRFIANVVILPTRFGQTAPVPRSGFDSTMITVDYVPSLLADPNAQSYLRRQRCATQVFR